MEEVSTKNVQHFAIRRYAMSVAFSFLIDLSVGFLLDFIVEGLKL